MIAGFIIQNLGYQWTFGISGFIYILLFAGIFFLVPETAYQQRSGDTKAKAGKAEDLTSLPNVYHQRKPYTRRLAIHSGRLSNESFWKLVIKPARLIAFPAVVFSTVVYGSFFTWLIVLSLLSVTLFSQPPYLMNPAAIGLTNLALLGASLIAAPLSGVIVDKVAKFMARKNNGIFEPEFRLIPMIIAVILSSVGFLGYGLSVSAGAPVYWPVAFQSIHAASVPFATQASFAYTIDCHPHDANQAFVTINFFKAVLTFLATALANPWLEQVGPRSLFFMVFGLNLGICLLTIPMYVFGKRLRSTVRIFCVFIL